MPRGDSPSRLEINRGKTRMEPRMLMKNKHLSEELKGGVGPFQKMKYLKINELQIFVVGYLKVEK